MKNSKKIWNICVFTRTPNRLVRTLYSNLTRKDALENKKWIIENGNWYQHNNCGYYLSKNEVFRIKKNERIM